MAERSRIVVVLGMHRAGTSAFTAGLHSLGVDLGDRLIEPGPDENPKGFFEDAWVLDFSERLLAALGARWDSMALFPDGWWQRPELDGLRLEACDELRSRFHGVRRWGFKNPRTARLLPFWQGVFAKLELDDAYLITVRNPISVARSLAARNGFHPAKSHLLWLLHMSDAWSYSAGRRRVVADYDALVEDPDAALRRIARGLGLRAASRRAPRVADYAREFVAEELRHTTFEDDDLALEPDAPELARRTFEALARLSRGAPAARDPKLERLRREIRARIVSLRPVFEHLERLERRAESELREQAAQRASLDARIAEERAALRALQAERERVGGELDAARARIEEGARERTALGAELQSQRDALGLARERQELLDSELVRLRAGLEHSELERARLEGELRAQRQAADAGREQLERARDALAVALEERRGERDRLDGELARARDELVRERGELARTRTEREQMDAELGRLQQAFEGERQRAEGLEDRLSAAEETARRLDFLRRQRREALAVHSRELGRDVAQWRATRTWRTTRRLRRALDRLRRGATGDALADLGSEIAHLEVLCGYDSLPEDEIGRRIERLRAGHAAVAASETYRAARAAALLQNLLRLRLPAPGPAELAAARLEALRLVLGPPRPGSAASPRPAASAGLPASDVVDVVVPVYAGLDEARRCLESVRRARNRTPCELIVIDDSGGESGVRRALEDWSHELGFTRIENPGNLGYVASCNRGIGLHPERDVVLLNSDAVVNGDWLDRLRRAAYGEWRVGSVTPWSNNAEICSYPALCEERATPGDRELRELDERCARVLAARTATLPTSVGFCSYLRRDCLEDVGPFDAERFGRGYGEENDFSMRARALGWRHVLAADTFVAHTGGVSFGASKGRRIEEGLRTLAEIHPRYLPEVRAFVERDPLLPLRRRLDLDRVAGNGTAPAVLMVDHGLGGGTGRHVRDLARRLEEEGVRSYLLDPDAGANGSLRLRRAGTDDTPNLRFGSDGDEARTLHDALRTLGIRHVHFHHLLGLPAFAAVLPAALDASYDVTVHDYFPICPRVHLVDGSGRYCGEPDDVRVCARCVSENGSPMGTEIDVARWRSDFASLLAGARRVFVPSEDAAKRLARYFPSTEFTQRAHFESPRSNPPAAPERDGVVRVAVIGAIGAHKGSQVLVDCARDADARDLPLEFHLVGYSDRDDELRELPGVSVHGPYRDEDVQRILADLRCHRALLPSVWPETWCYTLSIAFDAGLHPLAFDLGAIAERIRELGWGELLDRDAGASQINDRLLAWPPPPFPSPRRERSGASARRAYYADLF